jgi:hypothetical protein
MDETADEGLRLAFDDGLLPISQPNRPLVFRPRSVLRKEADQRLREHVHLRATLPEAPLDARAVPWQYGLRCVSTLGNDSRVSVV